MTERQTVAQIRDRETLNQVSILQSLSQGDFLGSVTVGELRTLGDTGIGTFDGLEGELVMIGGDVFQCRADGLTVAATDAMTVPFADVTFMDADYIFELEGPLTFEGLCAELGNEARSYNPNLFYMATIDCQLAEITVRSALPRWSGSSTLAEHMVTAQKTFSRTEVAGTIVALYCPPFMSSINLPGWHLHFISEDRSFGGHILDLRLDRGFVTMDQTRGFSMILPDASTTYANLDLTKDQSADLKKVESK
ncbi:MAG: acetolactate decarboxylase [Coriobacteriia bacterium]|nr:acetolactate decarboxylase [Coriobacteriia bacterium]